MSCAVIGANSSGYGKLLGGFVDQELVLGATYQHYKGMQYKVHAIVLHSETLEEMVFYEALYENSKGRFWVRPKEMFLGTVQVDGKEVRRFIECQT